MPAGVDVAAHLCAGMDSSGDRDVQALEGEKLMLCPSCNKFASNSTDTDPELEGLDCENGQVSGRCRIVVTSECCGDELKEANFDIEVDLTDEITDALETMIKIDHPKFKRDQIDLEKDKEEKVTSTWGMLDEGNGPKFAALAHIAHDNKSGVTFDITHESASMTDRSETTKTKTLKSGKVVTRNIPYRYQRRFYGCEVEFTVVCEYPYKSRLYRVEVEGKFEDEVQASGMDELT